MELGDDLVRRVQGRLGATVGGKWRLERVLGIGGMAAVNAAVHRNQNKVAIKMLHPEQSLNNVVRQRFLREGYAANSVDHPGAVRVLDDDVTADGAAFLVMELLEGESLEDRRDRHGGRLPAGEVLALVDQILDVLAAAHDKGIVHRDIKPDNLFLTLRGELKVLDFGIAHVREVATPTGGTSVGTFMGTPSYMPPEQARARWDEVDARSDLWALGAVMFVLLSGRMVREADTVPEQLAFAVRDPAPLLSSVAPSVPDRVAEIVDRALAYDKSQRFQDARRMQLAVREAIKVVGRPETISVAVRPTSSQRQAVHDADTMLASSDNPRPQQSLSTSGVAAPPSTLASDGSARPRRSRMPLYLLGALLAGALVATTLLRRSPDVAEPATSLEPVEEMAPPNSAKAAPEVAPLLEATSASAASSSPSALPSAAKSLPPVTRKSRGSEATLHAVPSAAPPAPAKNPQPGGTDPFDKRF